MKTLILACALALTASGCTNTPEGSSLEFVCYDDGKLVERHVGVQRVYGPAATATWTIVYKDRDQWAIYHQPMGETCGVEVVADEPHIEPPVSEAVEISDVI